MKRRAAVAFLHNFTRGGKCCPTMRAPPSLTALPRTSVAGSASHNKPTLLGAHDPSLKVRSRGCSAVDLGDVQARLTRFIGFSTAAGCATILPPPSVSLGALHNNGQELAPTVSWARYYAIGEGAGAGTFGCGSLLATGVLAFGLGRLTFGHVRDATPPDRCRRGGGISGVRTRDGSRGRRRRSAT